MYLSRISTRKIAGITDALSKVKVGKDAVSRIASRSKDSKGIGGSALLRRRLTSTWTLRT
jgi:hypothetical protein